MDIEHPDITRINRFGYHDPEAFDYEMRIMTDETVEDEEVWPDGLTLAEWHQIKNGGTMNENNVTDRRHKNLLVLQSTESL